MTNDEFHSLDQMIVTFDKERQLLILHNVYSDGTTHLDTHVELSRLKKMGIEAACQALGKNILTSMPTTRQELFTQSKPKGKEQDCSC